MSEASLRRRRFFSKGGSPVGRSVQVSLIQQPSQQPRKKPTSKIMPRCASEPILWIVQLVPDDVISESDKEVTPLFIDPTFYSCNDLFDPSTHVQALPRLLHPSEVEKKVLVSVTVEGSVGAVKAMVKLGASVEEAIKVVLQRYKSEGRSPRLDTAGTASFQLHHSHFSLQSLNKNDKIGEVGGRSFYLHKNCEAHSYSGMEERDLVIKQSTDILSSVKTQAVNTSRSFMSFIIKKFNKIKRRTVRLWRVVTCDNCL